MRIKFFCALITALFAFSVGVIGTRLLSDGSSHVNPVFVSKRELLYRKVQELKRSQCGEHSTELLYAFADTPCVTTSYAYVKDKDADMYKRYVYKTIGGFESIVILKQRQVDSFGKVEYVDEFILNDLDLDGELDASSVYLVGHDSQSAQKNVQEMKQEYAIALQNLIE